MKRLYMVNNCLKGYNCKWLEAHTIEPIPVELDTWDDADEQRYIPVVYVEGWKLTGTVVKSRKSALRAARNMIAKINKRGIEVEE